MVSVTQRAMYWGQKKYIYSSLLSGTINPREVKNVRYCELVVKKLKDVQYKYGRVS